MVHQTGLKPPHISRRFGSYESASKLLVWVVFIPTLGHPVSFSLFLSQLLGYRFVGRPVSVFEEATNCMCMKHSYIK